MIELRLTQQLRLNLELQIRQSQIFGESTDELLQTIDKELADNPMLELVSERRGPGGADRVGPGPVAPDRPDDDPGLAFDPRILRNAPRERSLVALENPEDRPFDRVPTPPLTLAEHLQAGLGLVVVDPGLRRLTAEVIGNLDEDGYLRDGLDEIAMRCEASVEDAARALAVVQSLDPPGVGARSLQECLLLQLRRDPSPHRLAIEIVERHWDDLLQSRIGRIALRAGLPRRRVEEAIEAVSRLDPRPGRPFGGAEVHYSTPDVAVCEVDGEWLVLVDDDGLPRLRPSRLYGAVLDGPPGDTRRWVKERLKAAEWFIRCIYRRQATLRRVTESIMRVQRPFLEGGIGRLRPLTLREVAEEVGVHESTVSRLARRKYVDTPHGVFELRRFFTHAVPTQDGAMVSVDSALSMVQAIVAGEDPAHPLSDAEISASLATRGLAIKRRTVAKYRDSLGIAKSNVRRRARGVTARRQPAPC
ncbi:MAG TPA: RNA polymerase factor sigma-54 [Methylomirabilota bacterium]|jgi:RNA polymerase sigma-54 factor|nr:RNA polymerase factor sigma-54 [Methylomirabilota bacterium]